MVDEEANTGLSSLKSNRVKKKEKRVKKALDKAEAKKRAKKRTLDFSGGLRAQGVDWREGEESTWQKRGQSKGAIPIRRLDAMDEETADLEAIVFGRGAEFIDVDCEKKGIDAGVGEKPLTPTEKRRRKKKAKTEEGVKKIAWVDPDDAALTVGLTSRRRQLRRTDEEVEVDGVEYQNRLREQHHKLHGTAAWATRRHGVDAPTYDSSDDEEAYTAADATSARLVAKTSSNANQALPPSEVNITRSRPLPSLGPISAINFHPNSELLLTAGQDKRVRLFNVDGEENPEVASYMLADFPIRACSFSPNGDQVLATGQFTLDYMNAMDVETGVWQGFKLSNHTGQKTRKINRLAVGPHPIDQPGLQSSKMFAVLDYDGNILIHDVQTKFQIRTLRMPATGASICFSPESDTLWSADEGGGIYEWDLGTGRCKQRTRDPWATKITRLSLSRTSSFASTPMLAVGTASGNVDFFDASGPSLPSEPTKSVGNLTTKIGSLNFHRQGELLVAASGMKPNQLKLVHAATGTVYKNWPTDRLRLGTVSATDFSRHGGLLAIGNYAGKVQIYRLDHYSKS